MHARTHARTHTHAHTYILSREYVYIKLNTSNVIWTYATSSKNIRPETLPPRYVSNECETMTPIAASHRVKNLMFSLVVQRACFAFSSGSDTVPSNAAMYVVIVWCSVVQHGAVSAVFFWTVNAII